MKIVDLNVLLYAVNSNAPEHVVARAWWEASVNDEEPVGLPWVVILGFLRLATSPRVFAAPLSTLAAVDRVERWLAQPSVRIIREKDDHWATLTRLLAESGSAGNLTTDAHLAALAITHGATLMSTDADFSRYEGLRWMNPLKGR